MLSIATTPMAFEGKELNLKFKLLLACILVVFSSFTAYTLSISNQSLLNFGYELITRPDTAQVVIDLYIMAFLAIVWMYLDIKKRGEPIWHWVAFSALTVVFVSIGPLLYLVLRSTKLASTKLS